MENQVDEGGTLTPDQPLPVLYAMAGNDCSLHHDLTKLPPQQEIDHRENQILTCALQITLIGLSKNRDNVALAKQFAPPVGDPKALGGYGSKNGARNSSINSLSFLRARFLVRANRELVAAGLPCESLYD